MIAPIEINRVTVKGGAGMPTSEYAQLVYKGEEIGFISEQGIFLKMWHPELKAGVFQNINTFNDYRLELINGLSRYGQPIGIKQQVVTEAVVPFWFRDITVKER